jgi:uncharacterized protein (DUF1697 family)
MRYIAFLRAINVRKHNRIRMEDLRSLCSEAGLEKVQTYLQTGNVLFETKLTGERAAALIEETLAAHGLRNVVAAVRQKQELAALMATNAFANHPMPEYGQLVTLFRDPLPEAARELAVSTPGVVAVTKREVCAFIDRAQPGPRDVNGALEKRFKLQGTTRYWHVVEAAAALLGE